MGTIVKPLLAGTVLDYTKIKYPVIATPKLDGIRCLIVDGKAVSRNFKEIPNKFIANILPTFAKEGMDGEILLKGNKPFNEISSAVMSFEGQPDFEYHVFDYVPDEQAKDEEYQSRLKCLLFALTEKNDRLVFVPTTIINNEAELIEYEAKAVEQGYEGIMIRRPEGKYKFGRSSEKEGILLKIKRFEDSEAEILTLEEKRTNLNEKTTNVFGYSERSSKKEGIVLAGTLGAIHVRDIKTGLEFSIGSGFNDELRNKIWNDQDKYIGSIVKYKFQPAGAKDLPRFPVFIGFRHQNDIS